MTNTVVAVAAVVDVTVVIVKNKQGNK